MDSLKNNEVKQLIDKLADRYNNLPEGPLHPLDADLMLSLLRQLYEKVEALRSRQPVEIIASADPRQYSQPEIVINEPRKPSVDRPSDVPRYNPPIEMPTAPVVEPVIKPVEQTHADQPVTPEEPTPIINEFHAGNEFARDPGPVVSKPFDAPTDLFGTVTVADKLRSDSPSVKDKITYGKHEQTLADRIHLKPISDLKAAIGINEKFQFINELFEGSADRYNEAINLLNVCTGSSEANLLFDDLKTRYTWDEQNPAFKRLHEFVVRRYLAIRN